MAFGASEYDLDDERVYSLANLAVTAGVALLVGVLLGAGIVLMVLKPGARSRPASISSAPTAPQSAPTPTASRSHRAVARLAPTTRSGDGPFDPGQGPVPAGWVRYFSPRPSPTTTGWSIATPGWTPEPAGEFLRLRKPGYGYVAVATRSGASSPRDLIDGLAGAFAGSPAYRNLGIRSVRFRGSDAADWEFTYRDSGAELHAVVRAFVLNRTGYLVWFQTRTSDWTHAQGQRTAMLASFRA